LFSNVGSGLKSKLEMLNPALTPHFISGASSIVDFLSWSLVASLLTSCEKENEGELSNY